MRRPLAASWLALSLLWPGLAAQAGNVELTAIEIGVTDLARARQFYTEVLQCVDEPALSNADGEMLALRLGDEQLWLRRDADATVPAAMQSDDPAFQHLAIVVSDIDAAYRRLQSHRTTVVSSAPQTLPSWNYDAAGIRALYFRDPDGHFLELIQFPSDKGEPRWQARDGRLFLGIDHTAIVVQDLATSRHFYRDVLGLTRAGSSFNHGPEQDALNGVPGSAVRIESLRTAKGPGIELLQYETPRHAGLPHAAEQRPTAWRIDLIRRDAWPAALDSDPDGHALRLEQAAPRQGWRLGAEALRRHWPRYGMEAAQLGLFMVVTLWLTVLLEHPASPLRRAIGSSLLRRMLMGLGIGGTVATLIYSPWGRQSGAQFNPAVTLAQLSLDRIEPWDAAFYVVAQSLGGVLGLWLASLPMRRAAAHPEVRYVVTEPKAGGAMTALPAEFGISFLLFFSLLQVSHSDALKPWIGAIAALHLWAFISFEAPLSGMSLNPARSLASALLARRFRTLWIYFVAPPLAMLLAARVCRWLVDS